MGKHTKRFRSKPASKEASLIKLSNKKYSKLLKRKRANKTSVAKYNMGAIGKPKFSLKSKRGKSDTFGNSGQEDEDNNSIPPRSIQKSMQRVNGKRKFANDDEVIESDEDAVQRYEKQPRRFEHYKSAKRVKSLLPLKDKSGLIQQYMNIEEKESDNEEPSSINELETETETNPENDQHSINDSISKNSKMSREKKIASCKLRIATLATAILSDPVSKLGSLNELRSMLDDADPSIEFIQQKLAMVSLLEIYKDILPSYKIRTLSEQEKDQKLKSDTKQLHDYELNLLKSYKTYLQKLEIIASVILKSKNIRKAIPKNSNLNLEQVMKLGEVAVMCLCDLLVTHPNFNFSHNIILTVIPFAGCKNENASITCCNSLKMLYKQDKLGDISLEGVRQTSKLVKEKSYNLNPKILETLLYLKIKDIRLEDIADEKVKKLTHKEKLQTMSRREFKRNKKMEKLENELQETAAEESKKKKMTFQTEIIKQVFLTYFGVLKKAPNCILLGAVLEGLAKFAHLINIEFFDDLISVLHQILDRGILDVRQCLHCIETVFTILSGQGSALNIDPIRFYTHCYRIMMSLNQSSETANEVPLLVTCLDMMINKRKKQVSLPRVFAFTHRACTVALQLNHNAAIAVLSVMKSFVQNFPRLEILLDGETGQANGAFLPELDDPEHCNAGSTALWEIHLLKSHYHPTVAKMASHISVCCPINGDGQLPLELARKSPLELFDEYNPDEISDFNPPLPSIQNHKATRRMKLKQKHWKPVYSELHQKMVDMVNRIDLGKSFKIS